MTKMPAERTSCLSLSPEAGVGAEAGEGTSMKTDARVSQSRAGVAKQPQALSRSHTPSCARPGTSGQRKHTFQKDESTCRLRGFL